MKPASGAPDAPVAARWCGWRWAAAVATGLLLYASFPPLEWAACAWFALVPLGWAVVGAPLGRAAAMAFVAGATFWVPTLHWIGCVTVAGWLALALYCSLYAIPPAWTIAVLASPRWRVRPGGTLALCAGTAAAWAGWEVVRGRFLTGFPWNPIGVSQYRNLPLIQHAEWGGVPAVSAIVVWVNAMVLALLPHRGARRPPTARMEWALAALAALAAVVSGARLLARPAAADRVLRVGLIQPAIPQNEKWSGESYEAMYARLDTLSRAAASLRPDLIVWPETALPENYRASGAARALAAGIVEAAGIPLLIGALDTEANPRGELLHYNAALLIGHGGEIVNLYRKQHLVLFGEFVPFRRFLPWLSRLVPVDYDIEPGQRPTVFRLDRPPLPFATMICFEDTIDTLAIEFARAGARALFVQTNDAWFDGTSGPRQHMIQSVFRAIETRTPVVRCANSGVTCWIDPLGRIGGDAGEAAGSLPVTNPDGRPASGFLSAAVPIGAAGPGALMVRHGPLFGTLLAVVGAAVSVISAVRRFDADSA